MVETYVSGSIPAYVKNNVYFFEKIIEKFYAETANTYSEEEYHAAVASVLTRYKKELMDEKVMSYLIEEGYLDSETVEEIRAYYTENAEPFQKTLMNAGLESEKRYTLVYMNEFGFPVADQVTIKSVCMTTYAQYTDAVSITFRRKGKRKDTRIIFYDCSLAVYEGWHDLKKEVSCDKLRETEKVTVYQSKYACFDPRFFEDCLKYFGRPIVEYKNYKVKNSDGKIIA